MTISLHTRFVFWGVLVLVLTSGVASYLAPSFRSHLFAFASMSSVLIFVFGRIIRRFVSRPIHELASTAKTLSLGAIEHRFSVQGDEEIAFLGASLNTMIRSFNTKVKELAEGKQSLELILAAMGQGVMVLDRNGRISLTNLAIRNALGVSRDVSGMTVLEIFRRPDLEQAVRDVLSGGDPKVLEITSGNGRIFEASVGPVANAAGSVDSVVIVFHDLSDIRRTERMRRDFVTNVSHEFKTPLTSIRGYTETLLSGALQDQEIAKEFLRIIERNAGHLERLVTDLLTLARIESEPPVIKEQVDVKSIVDELIAQKRAILESREIRVCIDVPAVPIQADRSRLSTALSNLIDNAIYYNRTGGEVRISAQVQNGAYELSIADTGEGIPSEELPRIFERFYRVDKARSRDSGGTGLGLAIVKHAIETQGGAITVASRPGVGSTFTFRLLAASPVQLPVV